MVSILCLFVLLICCLSTVSAENIDDTNSTLNLFSDDANQAGDALATDENQLLAESGSFSELQEKINSASRYSTVELDNDYVYTDGDSPIEISKELTIDGKGKTIDGSNQANIFVISKKVTLKNITFINGKSAENGGAISFSSGAMNSEIDHCNFIDNTAAKDGGAIYGGCWNLKISNCEFKNNQVTYKAYGGPNNVGGGAIFFRYADANVINSKFENNKAPLAYGGAIFSNSGNLTVVGCEFINNSGNSNKNDGNGAMGGGAIHFADGTGKCTVSNCKFTENYALKGSAIHLRYGYLDISDTTFLKNLADASSLVTSGSNDIVVENHEVSITAHLRGYDNVINAIYTNISANKVDLKNVTYYGVNGEMNSGDDKVTCVEGYENSNNGAKPYGDPLVSKFEVILEIYDKNNNLVKSITGQTDIKGEVQALNIKLNPGKYTLKARHEKDDYYGFIESKNTFEIPKYETTVAETNVQDKAFRNIDITVEILDENNEKVQNGTAKFTFNNKIYEADVSDGKATFTNVKLPKPGNYTTNVQYITNDYYYASNNTLNIEVLKLDTSTSVDNISGVTGDTVSVDVNVVDEDGNPVTSGSVELTIYYNSDSSLGSTQSVILKAGNDVQTSEVSNGKATFTVTLQKPGEYVVGAKYIGNDIYNPSSGESNANILKHNTTTNQDKNGEKIIQSIKESAGAKKDITVEILTNDGTPVKNGTAIMKINGETFTADVEDGKATFKDVVMPDDNTVAEVHYQGNDWYNPSNSTFDIIIEKKSDENETSPENDEETPSYEDDGSDKDDENETSPISGKVSKSVKSPVSSNATGNPIFAVLLVLLTLVCNSIRRRK